MKKTIDWYRIRKLLGLTWQQRRVPGCGRETWLRLLDWWGAFSLSGGILRSVCLVGVSAIFLFPVWAAFIPLVLLADLVTWPWQVRARRRWDKAAAVAEKLKPKPEPEPDIKYPMLSNYALLGAALIGVGAMISRSVQQSSDGEKKKKQMDI